MGLSGRNRLATLLIRLQEQLRGGSTADVLSGVAASMVRDLGGAHCELFLPDFRVPLLVIPLAELSGSTNRSIFEPYLRESFLQKMREEFRDLKDLELPIQGKSIRIRTLAIEPLVHAGQLLGSLGVGWERPQRFGSNTLQRLQEYAGILGILVMKELMQEEAQRLKEGLKEKTSEVEGLRHQLLHSGKLAAVGQLAAGIAHEFNSPLGAILTTAQGLLIAPADPNEAVEEIRRIITAVRRCQEITQGILDFSRDAPMELSPLNLNEVVHAAVSLIRHTLDRDQIRLVLELNPIPPVQGNRNELLQVVTNLLLNARDAVAARRKLVQQGMVTVGTTSQPGVVLTVQDNGVGVPSAILGKVFDPFFTTKEPGEGTGLGLAICRSIMERHRGEIILSSQPGLGTTVKVKFPES